MRRKRNHRSKRAIEELIGDLKQDERVKLNKSKRKMSFEFLG